MNEAIAAPPVELAYATAAPAGPRVWAGVVITFAGLILIAFGGCFLIGVMIQLQAAAALTASPFTPAAQLAMMHWNPRDYVFHVVLYVAAAICFIAGAWVTLRGLAALFRVVGGRGGT